jgi:hypothetical protein
MLKAVSPLSILGGWGDLSQIAWFGNLTTSTEELILLDMRKPQLTQNSYSHPFLPCGGLVFTIGNKEGFLYCYNIVVIQLH